MGEADFWHDRVCVIRVPHWSMDRVVLVGDAAGCVSLFGGGSSLAIRGAAALASQLEGVDPDQAGDLAAALLRYERQHRPAVSRHRASAVITQQLLVPRSAPGLRLRNALVRVAAAFVKRG